MSTTINAEDVEEFTPEGIAYNIFTSEPKQPCSCQLVSDETTVDITYLFEILLIILMEGLELFTGDLSKANLNELTTNHISSLNPWFRSLGFNIKVTEYTTTDTDLFNKQYCKIVVKDKLQEMFFKMKGIEKNYHFLLNGDNLEENKQKTNLKDLHTICIIKDKVFKISFEFYYPEIPANQLL
ncbi:hypothetical protein QKU48_gp0506 [Fadolivirus algeromassiliense]|jgi:hypothetical protein|uniref:Uncharacterized protein n=1 Tax=Fadolivirus FV1/VV64 TaxID=3070911 RepID=A0A7D3QV38_9VIRU|nr:hypothetical protein QKU48_gp0506 [Fadolivirus algeromassiliense]QKF93964.1 hypothetical protein Fadolivirus_1_506 [Fadolivirus FV1/VV64]